MSWLLIVGTAFTLIALAEIGDKTQLMTVSLASKYRSIPVFWGVFLGMATITVLGVAIGTILFSLIPMVIVKLIAGVLFVIFGIYTLTSEEDDGESVIDDRHVFRNSFLLSAVAEFGDKTQLAVIGLTARYAAPIPVLIGALGGLALVIGLGTILGERISHWIEREKIELGSSILFLALGIFFIVEALL